MFNGEYSGLAGQKKLRTFLAAEIVARLQDRFSLGHVGLALWVEDHFLVLRGSGTATFGGPGSGEVSLDGENRDIDDENYE
jgi:hypothetical protein